MTFRTVDTNKDDRFPRLIWFATMKPRLFRSVVLAGLCGMLLGASLGDNCFGEPPTDARVHLDIRYTTEEDRQRSLDVYEPPAKPSEASSKRPAVIWIHGGGWQRGNKRSVQVKPQAFNQHGYVFISVGYRFVPEVSLDQMAGDIAAAIGWVMRHADKYAIDRERVILAGHSAGAHLAALVATDESYLKPFGLKRSQLFACIPVDTAMYDVPAQTQSLGPLRRAIYQPVFGDDEASQKRFSPVHHVPGSDPPPPFLIVHVADRADSGAQSKAFAAALQSAGHRARVVAGEGKTHATINRELGTKGDRVTADVFRFLSELQSPQ